MNRLRLDWQRFFGLRERDERIEEERESAGSQRACHSAGESNAVAEPLEADIDADFDADEVPPAPRRSHRCGFMAPLHVAELWDDALRRVREVVDPSFDDGQCVTWMLLAFARAHASPEIREAAREHSCCERDGWACTMPGCRSRRLLHAHHVVFRSRQGKGDLSNLTTLCEGCHLRLVHEGKVVISGGAPDALTILTCIDALGRARETWRDETRVSGRSR